MIFSYEYSKLVTTAFFVLITVSTIMLVARPRRVLLPYLLSIFVFTGTMYGAQDVISTFYTRGAGYLGIPLVNFFLMILFIFYFIYSRLTISERSILRHPAFVPLCIIIGIYALYLIYGIGNSLSFPNMLSNRGLFNFINLMMLLLVLIWAIADQRDLIAFRNLFVITTVLMCLFGIVRYFLGEGDPANYYRNFESASISITFFDYGQLVLFTITSVYFFLRREGLKIGKQSFLLMIILMNFFNILLSFRRNAILGLFFVLLWVFFISEFKRKIAIFLVLTVVLATAATVFQARFIQSRKIGHQNTGIAGDLKDKSGKLSVTKGRFGELYHAIKIVSRSPIIGLGPWGINEPRVTQHEQGDFVHSTFVHMYIKSGLVGVLVYCWVLMSYFIWWIRVRNQEWNNQDNKLLAEAFFCGFLFEVPDLLFGTPIIIYRHIQILAMILAVPFICFLVDRKIKSHHAVLSG
jgi:O-antigen ligase/polysaccharide polymerase Wzy-like membrane protein